MRDVHTTNASLVLTVRNEAGSINRLLESVLAQSVPPVEVIVADGGSNDGTQDIVRGYEGKLPVRLVEEPGANISRGRNIAIREARCEIVACTDAGVRLDPRWLERLLGAFEREPGLGVASGFFVADPQSTFERAMGATVLPSLEEIDPEQFLPSSRSVAFRKSWWEAVGGYPEWLDYCEDLVFDMALKEAGARFAFVPDARVYFRPRPDLASFVKQYYRYARGDGKADLWRKRHAARYSTYLMGPLLATWGLRHRNALAGKAALLALGGAAASYLRRPYMRLLPMLRSLSPAQVVCALVLVPAIRLVGDVAKMAGYPVGVVSRLSRKGPRQS